jgi:hypothetical protein
VDVSAGVMKSKPKCVRNISLVLLTGYPCPMCGFISFIYSQGDRSEW